MNRIIEYIQKLIKLKAFNIYKFFIIYLDVQSECTTIRMPDRASNMIFRDNLRSYE